MPPRYAYWTILVDDQPTAFRSGAKEDLLPTFNRLKEKQPSAVMKWFQNGKLWESRLDAQEAMRARGEMGRRGDERQAGFRSRDSERRPARGQSDGGKRTAWTPRGEPSAPAPARNADDKLDWKPKGEFTPAPKRPERADWKPKTAAKPDWKSKGSFDREQKPEWKPKSHAPSSKSSDWKPKSFKRPDFKRSGDDSRPAKPEWKPKGSFDREAKREWKPKSQAPGPKASDWKPKSFKRPDFKPSGDDSRPAKPEWKPKGSFNREAKREWKPTTSRPTGRSQAPSPKSREELDWKPKDEFTPAPKRSERPEWKPKGFAAEGREPRRSSPASEGGPTSPEKRKWVPKGEYKKSQGIEVKKDKNWRPGGEHKDPRQKYKDAKKAKWTRFKTAVRGRWEGKQGKGPGKKGSN